MSLYRNKKWLICTLLLLLLFYEARPQTPEVSDQGYFNKFLNTVTVGGYFRGFFYGRKMSTPYGTLASTKVLNVGDPSYFDPMLYMYIGGSPTANSSFGVDLNIINPMSGPSKANNNFLNNFQTVVMRGNFNVNGVGKFNVILGGIEWTKISKFAFGGNVKYNRYSIFDRRPWDPGGNVKSRYASYYYEGSFNQDIRFGTNAFKGLLLSGWLAHKVSFDFYYGKASTVGGYSQQDKVMPKYDVAFKVTKELTNLGTVSFNTYNSITNPDSTNKTDLVRPMFNMYTGQAHLKVKGFTIDAELGFGGYQSPDFKRAWSPALIADIGIPENISKVPLLFRGYYIGQNFVNKNSNVQNTTITEANTGFKGSQGAGTLLPAGEQLTGVGDLVNNRAGGNFNTEIQIGRLRIQLANEISKDIDLMPGNTAISYTHRVNSLQWSRFVQFPNTYGYFGPNSRVNSYYRGVYETANLNDLDKNGHLAHKLAYNAADIQLKWKSSFLGRDLFLFNLNSFSTVGTSLSAIPAIWSNKSYLRAGYYEGEIYYNIHRLVMLDFYAGYEHIKGNQYTAVKNSLGEVRERDQTGKAFGVGFDLMLNNVTNLYFRYRWFSYEDKSDPTEKFKGQEGNVELKIFF